MSNARKARFPVSLTTISAALLLTAWAATAIWQPSAAHADSPPPATVPANVLDAILKQLADNDFQVRNAAQKQLDQVPAAQYAELVARVETINDPEVKARLQDRVATLAKEVEAAGGEAGAAIKVARLLAMPGSGTDPRGTMSNQRVQLIRDIGGMGDVAIKPLQDGLAKAQTPLQRRELTSAFGSMSTAAATRVLINLLAEKDDTVRHQAIESLADRVGALPQQGGTDDIVPALAKVLPNEKDEDVRWHVCAGISRVRRAATPDPRRINQIQEMLQERLKNDPSPKVRMWAAITLSELEDNSGLAELENATLAIQAGQTAAYKTSEMEPPLHRLIPALERGTGQNFGPVPMDPTLSSDMNAGPRLMAQRQELLDKVALWIKAHPAATAPVDTATPPAAASPGAGSR